MLKDPNAETVYYTTVRNIETGELLKAWPFSDFGDADQKRREENTETQGDLSTIAWIETLDPRVESYPALFKELDPRETGSKTGRQQIPFRQFSSE
jgi:hypothetical protein